MSDTSSLGALFRRWKRRLPLSGGDEAALANLNWVRKQYQRDAYLAREGEPTSVCTVLLQGFAFRQKILSDGSRQIMSFHIPGELLDAIESGKVTHIDEEDLRQLQPTNPENVALLRERLAKLNARLGDKS